MLFAVEAWTFPCEEDPREEQMEASAEFDNVEEASAWMWERAEEGFAVRLYRR